MHSKWSNVIVTVLAYLCGEAIIAYVILDLTIGKRSGYSWSATAYTVVLPTIALVGTFVLHLICYKLVALAWPRQVALTSTSIVFGLTYLYWLLSIGIIRL